MNKINIPTDEELELQLALVQTDPCDPFERELAEQEYYAWLAQDAQQPQNAVPTPPRRYVAFDPGLTDEQIAEERLRSDAIDEALGELRAERGEPECEYD